MDHVVNIVRTAAVTELWEPSQLDRQLPNV